MFVIAQHCKPAVDEETFQKMVERQYDTMKRERMRQSDEPQSAKPPIRPDEHEIPAAPQPTNAASSATEAQPSEQEVCIVQTPFIDINISHAYTITLRDQLVLPLYIYIIYTQYNFDLFHVLLSFLHVNTP